MEKLWNKHYLRAMGGNFLLFFSFFLLTPLLPVYLDAQFHADKDTIGLVLLGYALAALLIRPFSGYIVDTFNRKKVLLIFFFFFFILFLGYVGAGTLLMFAIIRTIHGLPFGAVTVSQSTVAMDVLPSSRRNEGIGFYGLSNNLAMAFAPSLGILIYTRTGSFQLLFWLAFILAFAGFVCAATIKVPEREPVKGKRPVSLDRFFLTRGWMMALNICFFALCWGILSNYVALYGQEELGITDGTGIFFALVAAGLIISRLFGRKNLRKGLMTKNAAVGTCISAVAYTLFAACPHPWAYYASGALLGLGNGLMYPAFLNMFIAVARHDQRGTANSSILIAWDSGMGIGMVLGGFLIEYLGYSWAFWVTAGAQITGMIIFMTITRFFFLKRRLNDN